MKKMTRLLALLLSLVCVLSLFAGCGSKEEAKAEEGKEEASAEASESAGGGDTLLVLSAGAFQGAWDPAANCILANKHAEWNIFDRLIHKDAEGNLTPGIATEWGYLEDGITFRVKIREGLTFHDGSELNAEDVKASVEWITRPESARSMDYTTQVNVTIVDDYTVDLVASNGKALSVLESELAYDPIMSKDDIEGEKLNDHMNGSGPYKMVKYENETLYMEAFEDYWDTENAPKIKYVEYKYVPESATRLYALQDGEAHLIERLEIEQVDVLAADENCVVEEIWTDEQRLMVFKGTQAPMDNPLLRQAIAYAIDTETIVNGIMKGKAKDSVSYTSTLNNITTDVCPGLPSYDPEKAKELLAEAGYPNGEGLEPLYYLTSTGLYPKSKETAEFIVKCLEDVGIPVELVVEEVATWESHLYQADSCHMIDTGWQLLSGEGNESITELFLSPSMVCGTTTPDIDELLAKQTTAGTWDERMAVIEDELYPLLNEHMLVYPMFDTMQMFGYSKNLEGVEILPTTAISFWTISFAE